MNMLLAGCANHREQDRSEAGTPTEAQMAAEVSQTISDFRRADVGAPLCFASGNVEVLVLPASAEILIRQGAKAVPVLRRHEDHVSKACISIIQARQVNRNKPRPHAKNGVELVSYTIIPND